MEDYGSIQIQLSMVQNQETVKLLNKVAVASLKIAVAAFFAIVILFYEIAVVNFVFLKKTHSLQKNLADLSKDEMSRYIIVKGGATEVIWRKYTDTESKLANKELWKYCREHEEWYVEQSSTIDCE